MKVVGVDLGGTKIHAGLVDEKGKVTKTVRLMTEAKKGKEVVIANIISAIKKVDGKFSAIGIGAPGPVLNGILRDPPNLSCLSGVDLAKTLSKEFKVPVFIDNDANCFLIGEKHFGSAKPYKNVVALTLGTGVGGGILIDGKIYRGSDGSAGELGHMVVEKDGFKCQCGNNGCLERYASGHGIVDIAQRYLDKGMYPPVEEVSAVAIEEKARNKDAFALKVMDDMATYLGIGLSNIVNIFNPECIVIGGSVTNSWDLFYPKSVEVMKSKAFKIPAMHVKVLKSQLGEKASILGAASLALYKE